MYRVHNITKNQLENFLKEGKTTREIGKLFNVCNTVISSHIRKYNLTGLYKYPKYLPYNMESIETKEAAYVLGFILADAAINKEMVEVSVAVKDVELAAFIASVLNVTYRTDDTLIKETRRFPRVRIVRKIKGINKFIGKALKKDRNVPIIRKDLEVYLLRGIFDADGCVTWGYRKDRNRIWHKVSFTSSLNILNSVQKILYKIGITTIVRPKSKGNCFVLEFGNKKDILAFYSYLYKDDCFIPLKRKFDNFNALRLELGGFSETT